MIAGSGKTTVLKTESRERIIGGFASTAWSCWSGKSPYNDLDPRLARVLDIGVVTRRPHAGTLPGEELGDGMVPGRAVLEHGVQDGQ